MQGYFRSRAENLCGTVVGRNWIVAFRRSSENEHPGARWRSSLDCCPGSGSVQRYWAETTVAAAPNPNAGASSG